MIECVERRREFRKSTWRVPASTLGRHACCAMRSGYEACPTTPELGRNREVETLLGIPPGLRARVRQYGEINQRIVSAVNHYGLNGIIEV